MLFFVIPGRAEGANPESITPVPDVLRLSHGKSQTRDPLSWRPGFTSQYNVVRLVWYEVYNDPTNAITREKDIKKWRRDWKIRLIEEENPDWSDLYPSITR